MDFYGSVPTRVHGLKEVCVFVRLSLVISVDVEASFPGSDTS